jgi:TPR repeat protein
MGLALDLVAWNRIKISQNRRDLEEFLTQFPKSEMAAAARLRLDQLSREAQDLAAANSGATVQPSALPPGQSTADAEAMFEEGKQLQSRRAYDAAWRLFLQAANMGHVRAMTQAGVALQHGQGVQQNYAEAMAWYQKAAAQGDAVAIGEIGFLHHNGLGVPMNFDLALQFYLKAANLGDASSMNNLGFLYFNGTGVSKDYVVAKDWFEKAANLGVGASCNYLGLIYENGLGINRSVARAAAWYRKGAALGNNNSKQRLVALGLK